MEDYPAREMTPAERRRRIKKIKRKRRIRLAIVIVAFLLLLCAVTIPVVALVIFRVDTFAVSGQTRYSEQEVITATDVSIGDSLLFLNVDKVKNSVESRLPYVDTATVEKQLPDTLVITLTAAEKVYAFETETGGYILASTSFKVLETVSALPGGATVVKCKPCVSAQSGENIAFATEGEDETLLLLQSINTALTKAELDGITLINLLDEDNIRLVYDSRLLLRLGENEKIESKLTLAKKVIDDQNEVNPTRYGMVNLKVAKKAYFLPCDSTEVELNANSEKEIIKTKDETGTEFTDVAGNEITTVQGETTTSADDENDNNADENNNTTVNETTASEE